MESCTPEGGEKKKPPEGGSGTGGTGESKSKRKMKTASQLELLEKTYAVETYPSEALRLELSGKLGLTDRQLQMWFCHRRLKDRKVAPVKRQKKDTPPLTGSGHGGDEMMMGVSEQGGGNEHGSGGSGSGSSPFEPRKGVSRTVAAAASAAAAAAAAPGSRIGGGDMQMVKRYYEPPQPISELRAIAFVEAQLGESLREDGPILGMEFDPLPPGAFGAPIAITGQQKQTGRSYDGKMYDRHDTKTVKTSHMPNMEHGFVPNSSSGKRKLASGNMHVGHPQTASRALHEYQFLPEQPSARSDTYERIDPSHFYTPPLDGPSARVSSLSTGGSYLHGKEQVPAGYGFQGPMSSANILSQQGRQGHIFNPAAAEYESVSHRNLGMDVQMGGHPIMGLENPLVSSDRRVCQEDDATRVERKRKNDEARIAREVEAHEKRIRKELEKQDILRRKREEQMRREMEKHDRERRKEEERLMREKQREEERFQREQKRELERRERFLQKENLRAEKMRQKEELRKEKEAARLKAANERATARRIAKESMELIEDERLELMELAVLSKGLPSIISLDSETLQNLDSFRDMLIAFPPKSVNLKKPFGIQPWIGSEENIGNLLMVWRFLITFADVLELWPFTLDEFVQAFHDYDPRLLGEIHVALLRSIIKDIEDVARTPSIGLGGGQNSSANPGGGHPQIVEGAYAWGFDIRSWQRHLNPLTWPEILRQFALSAGFGPQLKKRRLEQSYFRDDNEVYTCIWTFCFHSYSPEADFSLEKSNQESAVGNDGEDIVSTLRNGAAAENAAAVMQEKGFSNPRRSRHRLTPGTVKFAAFHVLSLEGSKGLTILEVAEKIQKSGLRDLTTSKTPEASIAAALSRDSNLFERTAPSTYCVRAAYRKDPSDAEAILSAAREKIQIFENGFSDSEEAEKEAEDVDEVERDEDSECELAEDPEVDDMGMTPNENKSLHCLGEVKFAQGVSSSSNEKRNNICTEAGETLQSGLGNAGNNLSSFLLEDPKEINNSGAIIDQSVDAAIRWNEACNPGLEDKEIDESNSGEPWVQGLMEADYSDLSVEERLNALVALIGVAIEGNSIRVILEERLEAANALKKQMWAEAQLDKRRLKEEYVIKSQYPSSIGIKAEGNVANSAVEGSQSPFGVDNKNSETPLNPAVKHEEILDTQNAQNYLNGLPTERNMLGQEVSIGADTLQQQHVYAAAEKSRAQLKAYIGQRAEEMYVFRSLPLGQDRRRNRYWQFVTSASKNDPGSGRIFFESQGGYWRLIDSEEAFDTLLASLDTRGIREAHLHSILQKIEVSFKEAVRRNLKCKNSLNPTEVITKIEAAEMSSSPDCTAEAASPSSIVCGFDSDTMDQSSSFRIELGKSETEKTNALKRYQDFQKWMWKECCNSSILSAIKYGKKRCPELLVTCDFCHDVYIPKDNHCPVCHRIPGTFSNNIKFSGLMNQCEEKRKMDPNWNFHNSDSSLPLRIRLLKAQLALTEVSVPPEALQPLWATEDYRNSWGLKLQSSLTAEDLLQNLTLLEGAIKRDYLSSNFETTKELLGSFMPTGSAVGDFSRGSVPILPWVPQTTAAVALRLLELDASISYMPNQKVESHKDNEAGEFFKVPSKYTVIKNIQEAEPAETPNRIDYLHEENWIDMGSGHSSSVRGRGIRGRGGRGRNRGGRWPKSVSGGKESSGKIEKMGRKSQARGRGGRRRGRRTVRSKQKPEKRVVEKMDFSQFNNVVIPKQNNFGESPISSGGEEEGWEEDERRRRMHVERDEHSNSIEASESDDNGQASGDEYDVQRAAYMDMYNGKSVDMMEESNGEEDEDDDDEDRDGYEDEEEADVDGEDVDMDIDMDREGLRNVDGDEEYDDEDLERNVDGDEGTESGSSDYSD